MAWWCIFAGHKCGLHQCNTDPLKRYYWYQAPEPLCLDKRLKWRDSLWTKRAPLVFNFPLQVGNWNLKHWVPLFLSTATDPAHPSNFQAVLCRHSQTGMFVGRRSKWLTVIRFCFFYVRQVWRVLELMESDRLSASETPLHNLLRASKLVIKSVHDQTRGAGLVLPRRLSRAWMAQRHQCLGNWNAV